MGFSEDDEWLPGEHAGGLITLGGYNNDNTQTDCLNEDGW